MSKDITNLAASVRQRLLNLSRESEQDFQRVLIRYGLERLLYRLSSSQYSEKFILKGAMLFYVWKPDVFRPTKDMDLLGIGEPSLELIRDIFKEICLVDGKDGLIFNPEKVMTSPIRELHDHNGVRVKLLANLEQAKIPLQVDIGYGNIVYPSPEKKDFPILLVGPPSPSVLMYPVETLISEKFEAMVSRGEANSRVKDIYDIYTVSNLFSFRGSELIEAIDKTFNFRKTTVTTMTPGCLTPAYYNFKQRTTWWANFIRRNELSDASMNLSVIGDHVIRFMLPPYLALAGNSGFKRNWTPGGPWK